MAEGTTCTSGSYGYSYGQCKSGRCTCGNSGEPCCLTSSFPTSTGCATYDLACTSSGTSSLTSTCQPCGKNGGPCCANDTCTDAGTQCLSDDYSYNYTCKVCGGTGQACCSSFYSTGPACKDPGTACDSSTGVCKACGAAGGPCCANSTCTGPGTTCKNSLCVVCGTPGTTASTATPCCDGNTCTSGCCITRYGGSYAGAALCIAAGAACDTLVSSTTGPVCDLTTVAGGTCSSTGTTACGGLNQACCVSSSYYSSSTYDYCGAPGSRCLSSTSATTGLTQYLCNACGSKDQRCCIDNTSYSTPTSLGCKSPYLCTYDLATGNSFCKGT
jgi:hypothetical protein